MTLLDLEWWVYIFIAVSFFVICLALNYIIKKVNEAKLDERFTRVRQKVSTTQATQVQGPLIEIEINKTNRSQPNAERPPPPGISLVFNQEDNKRRKDLEDTINIIKNTIDTRKYEALSLNTNKSSQEIYEFPKLSDHNTYDPICTIKKETDRIIMREKTELLRNEDIPDNSAPPGENIESRCLNAQDSHFKSKRDKKKCEAVSVKNNDSDGIMNEDNISIEQSGSVPVKKRESDGIVIKDTPSDHQTESATEKSKETKDTVIKDPPSINKSESFFVKKKKSDGIVIKNAPSFSKSGSVHMKQKDFGGAMNKNTGLSDQSGSIPVKKKVSDGIVIKDTPSFDQIVKSKGSNSILIKDAPSFNKSESIPVKPKESSGITKKYTSTFDQTGLASENKKESDSTPFKEVSSFNKSDSIPVKKKESSGIIKQDMQSFHQSGSPSEKSKESGAIVVKENLLSFNQNIGDKSVTDKSNDSERIPIKEAITFKQSDDDISEYLSLKNKDTGITQDTPSFYRGQTYPVKKKETAGVVIKDTPSINKSESVPMKKKESERIPLKDSISFNRSDDDTSESAPVKKKASRRIVIKETSSYERIDKNEVASIKNKHYGRIDIIDSTSLSQCETDAAGLVPILKKESKNFTVKDNLHKKDNDDNISGLTSIQSKESSRVVIDENSSHSQTGENERELIPVTNKLYGRINITQMTSNYQTANEILELINVPFSEHSYIVLEDPSAHSRSDNTAYAFEPKKSKESNPLNITEMSNIQTENTSTKLLSATDKDNIERVNLPIKTNKYDRINNINRSPFSQPGYNESGSIPVKNKELGEIDLHENATCSQYREPVKSKDSGNIPIKDPSFHSKTNNVSDSVPVKNKETTYNIKDIDNKMNVLPGKIKATNRLAIEKSSDYSQTGSSIIGMMPEKEKEFKRTDTMSHTKNKITLSEMIKKHTPGDNILRPTTSYGRSGIDINESTSINRIASSHNDKIVRAPRPANNVVSGHVTKEISTHHRYDNDVSEVAATKKTATEHIGSFHNQSKNNDIELVPYKISESNVSGRIFKESSFNQNDSYVSEFVPIQKNESRHTEIETSIIDISLTDSKEISSIKKPDDDISVGSCSIKKTVYTSGLKTAGPSNSMDQSDPVGPTNPIGPSNFMGPPNPMGPTKPMSPSNPMHPSSPTGPSNPMSSTEGEAKLEKGLTDWIKEVVPLLNEDLIVIKPERKKSNQ